MLDKLGFKIKAGQKILYNSYDCICEEKDGKLWLRNMSLGGDCLFLLSSHCSEELLIIKGD